MSTQETSLAAAVPAADAGELRSIALNELHESPLNSRKYFAEGPMAELTESIRHDGVRVPLIVRPRLDGDGYEIAAGHRRRRAALTAGIAHVPCVVRDMSDAEFLKLITFDNLQREDVHPLEEAEAFALYMREALADVPEVAGKAGKSGSYVYARLKLLDATDEVKRAMWDGKITPGHGVLIARRDREDQLKALRACQPPEWNPEATVMSVRDLAEWMRHNLDLDLADAPFPIFSADLLPAPGACPECPHRSGNQPDFDPIDDLPNICLHPECYAKKVAAHVEAEKTRLRAVYEDDLVLVSTVAAPFDLHALPRGKWWDAHRDQKGRPALLVDGDGVGSEIRVYLEDPAKPKPAPKPPEAPKPAAAPKPSKEEREREAKRREEERKEREAEEARQKREREEAEAKLEKEKTVRKAILGAILEKVAWPPKREEFLCLLDNLELPDALDDFIRGCGIDPQNFRGYHLEKCSDAQLVRLAVMVTVSNDFDDYAFGHGADKLYDAAKRYGVDHRKIRAEAEGGTRKAVVAKLPALANPAPAKKAPAKKAAAKKSAPVKAAKKPAKKGAKK